MTTLLLILVALGFVSIVIEDIVHIDKAKTTLFFGSFAWLLFFIAPPGHLSHEALMESLNENLLDIATLWLFLMAAMTFVAYLSGKGIIDSIVNKLLPSRISERKLMLLTGLFAFLFSSMADNITATLVCIAVLMNLNLSAKKLLRYIVLVVFSVNAGGTALITGDVTTLMIFLAGKVEIPDLLMLSLPAAGAVAVLAVMLSFGLSGDVQIEKQSTVIDRGDKVIALLFFATILGTIAANVAFGIPPVLCFLFGLSLMFMVVQFMNKDEPILEYIRKIEFDTLLFFLGVLLLVGMLKELGMLAYFPALYDVMPPVAANFLVGLASALFDNVPLTAALLNSGIEMTLPEWLSLTYSVGVGGALLVIGSAAGVIAMSKVEALTFASYLRYFGYLLVAYSVGFFAVLGLGSLV
ncbi:sodium:proton antiporter [Alcanivorax sp. P2S70]|jgi:Na+/H+ antiporter NhaD/arsenite permease-like protein|uniref:Sodium:proton antiporter n=1 Tax=Alcanivorax profundi TaxID=2338368 RepID=A0A418XUH3_9GAMM|nr:MULTISPECIES: sodium:proton antiporter NhaD [Alcanivorax]ERP90019.1 sodium:proton antiporter [Alcanivorax sp. P2S70]RJG16381.1 sodium:proton antiporter [Alcanivorax profundi]|tara:strand:- start:31 stop:1260 length:1230 start_codon:yes stop_codon:yes gene_type:complete